MKRSLAALALAVLILLSFVPVAGAATFTVDVNGDGPDADPDNPACDTGMGICSLRAAIQQANAAANVDSDDIGSFPDNDEIRFDLGAGGAQTIVVSSALPDITENVSILGSTQGPGGDVPLITVNGPGIGMDNNGFHFLDPADNSLIEGLLIQDFSVGIRSEDGGLDILNNYIGVEADGDTGAGIANGTGVESLAQYDSIGDPFDGAGNVISGNTVGIDDAAPAGPGIYDTLIGLTPNGLDDAGNSSDGIRSAGGLTLTGLIDMPNVVSGNGGNGVLITGGNDVFVTSNLIGVDVEGNPLANGGHGVEVTGGTQNYFNLNLIANNGGAGLRISAGSGVSGSAGGHTIFRDNGGLAIDLGTLGVTQNDDAPDGDPGANGLQNFPVIDTAVPSESGGALITGSLTSAANRDYAIQFFGSPACDASGNGEGAVAAGFVEVTTNDDGVAEFDVPVQIPEGQVVTALAIDVDDQNMSEFSACRTVVAPSGPGPGGPGGPGGPILSAFGGDPLVTLALAAKTIKAKGPVKVVVTNGNAFAVTGTLSGETAKKIATAGAKKKKRKKKVKLKAKAFSIAASGKATVSLKLPKKLRGVLKRKKKLSLKLTALARDPAGSERAISKKLTPKLKKKRKKKPKR